MSVLIWTQPSSGCSDLCGGWCCLHFHEVLVLFKWKLCETHIPYKPTHHSRLLVKTFIACWFPSLSFSSSSLYCRYSLIWDNRLVTDSHDVLIVDGAHFISMLLFYFICGLFFSDMVVFLIKILKVKACNINCVAYVSISHCIFFPYLPNQTH